jgi:ubiquinone/menaquinone biosynthesis C-methylase UbiE
MATDDPIKRDLATTWDAGAAGYDRTPRHGLRHEDEWVAWRRLIAAMLGDPAHADVPSLRVLDVGTGTGVLALLAAELGHEVTGIDLSSGMLEEAARKAREHGLAIDLRLGDAEDLPAGLTGFDAIVSRHLLWTLPDPPRALASWRSAARPGGLIAIIDGSHHPGWWPAPLIRDAASRWLERRARPDHGHAYEPGVRATLPFEHQRDTRGVRALLLRAGLEHVRVRTLEEVDRVERAHLGVAERIADDWRRYLATGRVPPSVTVQGPSAADRPEA